MSHVWMGGDDPTRRAVDGYFNILSLYVSFGYSREYLELEVSLAFNMGR